MITASDQRIVADLREATRRIVVPPDSRWIRERGSNSQELVSLAVIAIAFIAIVTTLGAVRERVVPSTTTQAVRVDDDAAWARVRSQVVTELTVLRPTWVPTSSDSASGCGPEWSWGGTLTAGATAYYVSYELRSPPDDRPCSSLSLSATAGSVPDAFWLGFGRDRGMVQAGNRLVYVFEYPRMRLPLPPPYPRIFEYPPDELDLHLLWTENGATYEVIGRGYELTDLVRVVSSLQAMR